MKYLIVIIIVLILSVATVFYFKNKSSKDSSTSELQEQVADRAEEEEKRIEQQKFIDQYSKIKAQELCKKYGGTFEARTRMISNTKYPGFYFVCQIPEVKQSNLEVYYSPYEEGFEIPSFIIR
jgi:uncharacterized protein YxeA